MELHYTGKYYKALWSTLPFKNSDELDILTYAMENYLGLCYTTYLINCHCHHEGFNTVCKSTVNLAFLRLQPKIIKIREFKKVQIMRVSGTKQDGAKRNNGLFMFNILPEDKE